MEAQQYKAVLIDLSMPKLRSVRSYRKYYALTQEELANLLAVSQPAISRLEGDPDAGTLDTAFALQVLFAIPPRQVFRRLYQSVEDAVMARAVQLDRQLRDKTDAASRRKRLVLADMVDRASSATAGL